MAKRFAQINVDGKENGDDSIDTVTLKFELHVRPDGTAPESNSGVIAYGPNTPILIPYVKFSLFDFDHVPSGDGGEVSRAP